MITIGWIEIISGKSINFYLRLFTLIHIGAKTITIRSLIIITILLLYLLLLLLLWLLPLWLLLYYDYYDFLFDHRDRVNKISGLSE